MYHFNFLKKNRTYVPSYKYDFIRFAFNSLIFGFCLETFLILRGRYEKIYRSSFHKELSKVKEHDNRITDSKKKQMLMMSKVKEIEVLQQKLDEINKRDF